ncbi:MAG: hypothetical protein Ct9H300mP2_0590 [Candidatus Neomarinimicrobiota bacterium]|nr:MAG: hypothetical protein Ct9H300mP2_0590 [Candidatus Neomarinimicrobiota bacterium]
MIFKFVFDNEDEEGLSLTIIVKESSVLGGCSL